MTSIRLSSTTALLLLTSFVGTAATAQSDDRATQDRQLVRRLFPVVTLFDRTPASPSAAAMAARGPWTPEAGRASGADLGSSPSDAARIGAMDVSGVRLRMSPELARAALRASGYAPTPDPMFTDHRAKVDRNYDYAARVEQTRRARLAQNGPWDGSRTIVGEDWHKGDERVALEYVPLREGVEVAAVRYRIPAGRIGWEPLKAATLAKYGRPTRLSENLKSIRYCGDGACAAVGADYAELELGQGWTLSLLDGGALVRLADAQASQDAEASIRKTGKPSF